jgi:predicted RND superfamily exporter protein
MRERLLKTLANVHVNHPWQMLTVVIVLTLIFGFLAEHLEVTLRWADLLPTGDPRTIQFNKIIEEFVSSTSIVVVVQGEEEQIKQFADDLAPILLTAVDTSKNADLQKQIDKIQQKINELTSTEEINKLQTEITDLRSKMNRKLIRRVDYKAEVDFLRNHGLMLVKEDDLENIKDIFIDPNLTGLLFNINNSMEKEYVGKSESISTREKEDQAVVFLDGIQNFVELMKKYAKGESVPENEVEKAADKLLLGEPYFLSYDKKALILNAIPNFTMFDTDLLVAGTDVVQSMVNDLLKKYPDIQAGLTGFVPIGRDEMVYSAQSLGYTTGIALIAILALLIISFRMWVAPVFAILNLIVGILWAVGTAAVMVGQLNIMTQMMAVILLGLGIDFSIHIISNFTEWRAAGNDVADAMEKTFLKSGKGVITGALTTAFAFLTMMISSSRGMKEMGMVTGFGLLAILLTTLLLLPIFLVLRERFIESRRHVTNIDKHLKFLSIFYLMFHSLLALITFLALSKLGWQNLNNLSIPLKIVLIILITFALAGIISGFGLLRRGSGAVVIIRVLGYINLLIFPVGTALGIYTIWVLMKIKERIPQDISFRSIGTTAEKLSKQYVYTIVASLIITIFLIWSATRITFDQNYLNVEPKGLTSIALQDTVMDKFDMSMDYAMIITDNVEESRQFAKQYREMGSVAMTEDISYYLPSKTEQEERIPYINDIRRTIESASLRPRVFSAEMPDLMKEIDRLQMNVMEMQDMAFLGGQDKVDNKCKEIVGDPAKSVSSNIIQELLQLLEANPTNAIEGFSNLQLQFAPYFKTSVVKMCSTEPIRFEELPVTILDRYCNEARDKYLVTVFPSGNLWQDAEFLDRFVADLERVTDKATGMPPIFHALVQIIGRDGRNAMILTVLIVFLLLWLDFHSIRYALMAMIPLAIGIFWMVGLMYLTGQQFTVMNVMGLPMILGIGIDDGVHIIHRWLHEGKGKIRTVFASTGKAILLTSLTTMLAFGSLIFSIWRGFGHLGAALFVGVGACFLTTVLILPGIIGWIERKNDKFN